MEDFTECDVSPDGERVNPFTSRLASLNRSYTSIRGDEFVCPHDQGAYPGAEEKRVHQAFRELVFDPAFSCVGAKSALQRGGYRLGLYGKLASREATAGLAYDLYEFVKEHATFDGQFSTMVAVFTDSTPASQREFERKLWAQLHQLHELDRVHHEWDPSVSSDPDDPHFSFSFAEAAFFVVGLHPHSARLTRRFGWPTLVFNPHAQFEELRASGHFPRMQSIIRDREVALQGSINANLSDFGVASEARQYSGRAVEPDWRCPFSTGR